MRGAEPGCRIWEGARCAGVGRTQVCVCVWGGGTAGPDVPGLRQDRVRSGTGQAPEAAASLLSALTWCYT